MQHAPAVAESTAQAVLDALPPGWRLLGRAQRSGGIVLAHPGRGVALVDVAPSATPGGESRLRRALTASGFNETCPGSLPVAHVRVEPSGLALLAPLLDGSLGAQPPLALRHREWMALLADALEHDPDWGEWAPPRRFPWRWAAGGVALLASFGAGLLLGAQGAANLLAPAAQDIPARLAGAPMAPEPAVHTTPAPPAELATPRLPAAVPPLAALAPPAAEPEPAQPPAEPEPLARAPLPALPEPVAELALVPPLEDGALRPAEPAPSRPRPVAARRQHLAIDPGCAEAVLRYQQGIPLSWREMTHVRNGCRSTVFR